MLELNNEQKAIYALLADNVYWDVRSSGYKKNQNYSQANWTPVPDGWSTIKDISGSGINITKAPELEGFTARVFQKTGTNEIVIAYAGTEFNDVKGDVLADLNIGLGAKHAQATYAAVLYQEIKEKYKDADIKFTGHSLGGGLAAIMGVWFDRPAIVFDHAPFKQALINEGSFNTPSEKASNAKELIKTLKEQYYPQVPDSVIDGIVNGLKWHNLIRQAIRGYTNSIWRTKYDQDKKTLYQ